MGLKEHARYTRDGKIDILAGTPVHVSRSPDSQANKTWRENFKVTILFKRALLEIAKIVTEDANPSKCAVKPPNEKCGPDVIPFPESKDQDV